MPELPEVETVRQTLRTLVLDEIITDVEIYYDKIIEGNSDLFVSSVINQTIHDVKRMGKYLIFILDDIAFISHLRMEGKYLYVPQDEKIDKHTHVVFNFASGMSLRYHDVRKFGRIQLVSKENYMDQEPLTKLAKEPFDLTVDEFYESLRHCHLPIKQVLLDQTKIAGLGNIYANEVLFRCKIHPLSKADELSKAKLTQILNASVIVLNEAIALGGTTIKSFSSNGIHGLFAIELNVYNKEQCPLCNKKITVKKIGGRSTFYCTNCQKIIRKRVRR